ncbi:hypothetical protein D3C77_478590 [compost metagenome]
MTSATRSSTLAKSSIPISGFDSCLAASASCALAGSSAAGSAPADIESTMYRISCSASSLGKIGSPLPSFVPAGIRPNDFALSQEVSSPGSMPSCAQIFAGAWVRNGCSRIEAIRRDSAK